MDPLTILRRGLAGLGTASWLIARAGQGIWASQLQGDPLVQRRSAEALALFVWRPLIALLPLAGLVGLIAGIAVARGLELYRAELLILGLLVNALLRDVGPLVVGLFASGSVSVELAARLGAMSLNREMDALEALGHDPARMVLAPSLMGVLASAPVHMLLTVVMALLTAGIAIHGIAHIGWHDYTRIALSDDAARALLTGMMKAILFSLIAFGVGSTVGAAPVRTPADIGRRATTAFTLGLIGIFAAAALWTALA